MTDQPENLFPITPMESNRAALAEMLAQTEAYRTSQEYLGLLAFIAHMGNFSPVNALLLRIQKPGLVWAASAYHRATRFERKVKPGLGVEKIGLVRWAGTPPCLGEVPKQHIHRSLPRLTTGVQKAKREFPEYLPGLGASPDYAGLRRVSTRTHAPVGVHMGPITV